MTHLTTAGLALLLLPFPGGAQDGDHAERARGVADELEALGVEVDLEQVSWRSVSPGQAMKLMDSQAELLWGEPWFEAIWAVLDAFGLPVEDTPAEFRRNFNRGVVGAQLAWYHPEEKAVVFHRGFPLEGTLQERLIAHELAHAAQDQRAGIEALMASAGDTLDARLVTRCLLEGEGELAGLLFADGRDELPGAGLTLENYALTAAEEADGAMLLHYGLGREVMLRHYLAGGWEAVHAAWSTPPASTEQLRHPNKAADEPVALTLPELDLGEEDELGLVHDDRFGQLGLRLTLRFAGVPAEQAELATIGWDGDRLWLWRGWEGERAFLWRSVWDRELDAEQFAACLEARVEGTVRRVGRGVDWTWANREALAERLRAGVAEAPFPDSGSEADAASSAEAERRFAERSPRVEGDHQLLPTLGLRIPVPHGWTQREVQGMPVLARPGSEAELLAANVATRSFPLPVRLTLDEVDQQVRATFEGTSSLELLAAERVERGGTPALLLEYRQETPGGALHCLELQFLRGAAKVVVTASAEEDLWEELGPVLAAVMNAVELGR